MERERALGYYQGMRFALAIMKSSKSLKDVEIEVLDKMDEMRKVYEKEEVKT